MHTYKLYVNVVYRNSEIYIGLYKHRCAKAVTRFPGEKRKLLVLKCA